MSGSKNHEFSKICRLCINRSDILVNLLPSKTKSSEYNIFDIIERFTTIKINANDGFPQQICKKCVKTLNAMLQFQNKCKESDVELHKMKSPDENGDQTHIKIEVLDEIDKPNRKPDVEPQIPKSDRMESNNENAYLPPRVDVSQRRNYRNFIKNKIQTKPKTACHLCGELVIAYKLKYHINRHNGLKPYQCGKPNCSSKFTSPAELQNHIKLCHIDKPNLSCDVCGRCFKRKIALDIHRDYHFDPKLPCQICEKYFHNRRALKKHMLVHSQERNFPCQICQKSFQTRYTLRIHERIHTQEKPYFCHCGTSFAYKCLLKAHIEKKQTNCLPSSSY